MVSYDTPDDPEEAFDPLRDGPLRYCGYANEVGEAFAAWLPPFGVPASYAVAFAYVLVDTYDKANTAHRDAAGLRVSSHYTSDVEGAAARVERVIMLLTMERALDTLVWQTLASVAIPGFTIHQVVHAVQSGLELDAGAGAVAAAAASVAGVTGQSVDQVRALARFGCVLVALSLLAKRRDPYQVVQAVHSVGAIGVAATSVAGMAGQSVDQGGTPASLV